MVLTPLSTLGLIATEELLSDTAPKLDGVLLAQVAFVHLALGGWFDKLAVLAGQFFDGLTCAEGFA